MQAFRKYGIENFKFEILEECTAGDNLTELEQKWYNNIKPMYNQEYPERM